MDFPPARRCLTLLAMLCCLIPRSAPAAEAQPAPVSAAQVLSKLMPLPEHVPRTIMNPYHAAPAWKLWAMDPSPVTIDTAQFKGTFKLPTVAQRTYPLFVLKRGVPELSLEPLGQRPLAGFWDDCYMSLDGHHTHLRHPRDQFIDAGFRTGFGVDPFHDNRRIEAAVACFRGQAAGHDHGAGWHAAINNLVFSRS